MSQILIWEILNGKSNRKICSELSLCYARFHFHQINNYFDIDLVKEKLFDCY